MDKSMYEFDFEEQKDIEEIMNGISYLHHEINLVRDLLSMVDGLPNNHRINTKDLLGYFMNLEMITSYWKQQLDYQVNNKNN